MSKKLISARAAAHHALWHYAVNQTPVKIGLRHWMEKENPSPQDRSLAQEIAFGTVRRQSTLWAMSKVLHPGRLQLKPKERVLLWMALYQKFFMDRIPDYAIIHEAMEIAKRSCSPRIHGFLYHLLQKIPEMKWTAPSGDSLEDWSIAHSYPPCFIEKLLDQYGKEAAREILECGNNSPTLVVRIRNRSLSFPFLQQVRGTPFPMGILKDFSLLQAVTASPDLYIQNFTSATLVAKLAAQISAPERILDLCASPGGKLLAVHDLFPSAALHANDVSQEKIRLLRDNLEKYQIQADLACGKGQEYLSSETFDLILLDVPCSNSGVFNKRPEARWRFTHENIQQLLEVQKELLDHAFTLLKPNGQIWYLTCSILQEENERQVQAASERLPLDILCQDLILPNPEGWDGGFGAVLRKKVPYSNSR